MEPRLLKPERMKISNLIHAKTLFWAEPIGLI